MKKYRVRFDGQEVAAVNVDQPGCGFAFVNDGGNYYDHCSSREIQIIRLLNDDVQGCIDEGWVDEVEEI